jgi:hypothetical protein
MIKKAKITVSGSDVELSVYKIFGEYCVIFKMCEVGAFDIDNAVITSCDNGKIRVDFNDETEIAFVSKCDEHSLKIVGLNDLIEIMEDTSIAAAINQL